MRTTLNIDDELLDAARREARRRGVSLGTIVDEALRTAAASDPGFEDLPDLPVFEGAGLQPGVDLSSNRAIVELLDERAHLDQMR